MMPDSQPDFLLIDKPAGCTSFDVVRWVKRALAERRIGHLGTLDPFATGLLVVAVGRATRLLPLLQHFSKTYEAVAVLGATSTTGDPEGTIAETGGVVPTRRAVDDALVRFRGEISQIPPAFSAVKVDGERAYEKARRGEEVVLKPRTVTIHELTPTRFEPPELAFTATCSTGTYIRTLAADIGTSLECGAYLTSLRRTAIGPFRVEDAVSVDVSLPPDRAQLTTGARTSIELLAAVCPIVAAEPPVGDELRVGRAIPLRGFTEGTTVIVHEGAVLAAGTIRGDTFQPHTVLS